MRKIKVLDVPKHKTILLQILKDIYTDVSIAPLLGFKGGTACFLFYGLPRFSVDLDFDLLDLRKEEEVSTKLGNILQQYGEIKEGYRKVNTLFYLLSYEAKTRNIKTEISLRNFGSAYEINNYLGIPMLVMRKEDLFANKLVALLERRQFANRDLYDIWYFLKQRWNINQKIVEKRTKKEFRQYFEDLIINIERLETRHLLAGLGDLLDEKQKTFVKQSLKDETVFLLKLRLENLR